MRDRRFDLNVKDGGWTHHPDRWSDPDARMVGFTLVASRDGQPLAGHNVQAHIGSATWRQKPPSDVSVWLSSGWWIAFRNQFAQAPDAAAKIIASVSDELSTITGELERARGTEMIAVKDRLWSMTFRAEGPDYWR
jgi:hypothetical protein